MGKLGKIFQFRIQFRVRITGGVPGEVSDEEGVIESALVFIPLLVLFLISLQLAATVNFRNIDKALVQGEASRYAIDAKTPEGGEIVTLSTPNSKDDLRLLITHKERRLPEFLSSFPYFSALNQRKTDLAGVAVMERRG